MLVQHSGSGKPIDFFDATSGAYVPMTRDLERVRSAFNNIGIEPNSSWGFEVPEGQMRIHIGPERGDESAPTELTRMMSEVDQSRKEHPDETRIP